MMLDVAGGILIAAVILGVPFFGLMYLGMPNATVSEDRRVYYGIAVILAGLVGAIYVVFGHQPNM